MLPAKAFDAHPESEQIWLAVVKLEAENEEHQAARDLPVRARTPVADTEKVSEHLNVSTSTCVGLDEVCMFGRQQFQIKAARQVPEVPKTLQDSGANLSISEESPCRSRSVRCGPEAMPQRCHIVNLGKQTGGIGREKYQGSSIAGARRSSESRLGTSVG